MATRTKQKVSSKILSNAREILAFAEEQAKHATDWLQLHQALFGVDGKASVLLSTEEERAAFCRTAEYKRMLKLIDALPWPPNTGEVVSRTNGTITLHVPVSVHNALLSEAKAEGVSLDQLCLSKLVAQLREVV